MMQIEFIKLDNSQDLFFNILPQDWQDIIVPQWKNFKDSASIFIFKENHATSKKRIQTNLDRCG